MPNGVGSPRSRASVLADMGERSAFVARQRVGRPRRALVDRRRRWRRLGGIALTLAVVPLVVGGAMHWLLTTPRFGVASVEGRGASRVAPDMILQVPPTRPGPTSFYFDTTAVPAA